MDSMTEEHIKEGIGTAYTEAVASYAGFNIVVSKHDYGIDGKFIDVEYDNEYKRYSDSGFLIDFQLKSTVKYEIDNGYIIYDLEVKNYRDLIKTNVGNPRILVLYLMPRERSEWLLNDDNGLTLKKGAWWYSLRGKPNVNNDHRVRIKIPITNFFCADALTSMMERVKEGDEL